MRSFALLALALVAVACLFTAEASAADGRRGRAGIRRSGPIVPRGRVLLPRRGFVRVPQFAARRVVLAPPVVMQYVPQVAVPQAFGLAGDELADGCGAGVVAVPQAYGFAGAGFYGQAGAVVLQPRRVFFGNRFGNRFGGRRGGVLGIGRFGLNLARSALFGFPRRLR